MTWNLGENSDEVPDNIHELIRRDIQHDIYVFAAQNCNDVKTLEKNIVNLVGSTYTTIAKEVYRSLVLLFICRKNVKNLVKIQDIQTDHYKSFNKTCKAAAVGLKIADKNYAFVS